MPAVVRGGRRQQGGGASGGRQAPASRGRSGRGKGPAVGIPAKMAAIGRLDLSARAVGISLLVGVLWVAWVLLRGGDVGSYPYGFVAVGERGYPAVLATVAAILAFGLVVAAVLWLVDVLLGRRRASRPTR